MRSTAAQIAVESGSDLFVGWMWILPEQLGSLNHHPVDAKTALGSLLLDKGTLDRMQFAINAQPFQGRDGGTSAFGNRQVAGWCRLRAKQHHTRATLFQSTTELRAIQRQFIA